MESLPFDKLKEMIEEFKNKGLTETYKTIKLNEKKLKENEKEKKKKNSCKLVGSIRVFLSCPHDSNYNIIIWVAFIPTHHPPTF